MIMQSLQQFSFHSFWHTIHTNTHKYNVTERDSYTQRGIKRLICCSFYPPTQIKTILLFILLFVGLLYIRLTRYLNSFYHLNVYISVVAFFLPFFLCLSNTLKYYKICVRIPWNSIFEFIDAINVIFGVCIVYLCPYLTFYLFSTWKLKRILSSNIFILFSEQNKMKLNFWPLSTFFFNKFIFRLNLAEKKERLVSWGTKHKQFH